MVPPWLGRRPLARKQKPVGQTTGKESQPHSLRVQSKREDRFPTIPFALITVATPARANQLFPFALRLREPFSVGVWAGLSPCPGSLYHRFNAYSFSSQPFVSQNVAICLYQI